MSTEYSGAFISFCGLDTENITLLERIMVTHILDYCTRQTASRSSNNFSDFLWTEEDKRTLEYRIVSSLGADAVEMDEIICSYIKPRSGLSESFVTLSLIYISENPLPGTSRLISFEITRAWGLIYKECF